MKKSFSFTFNKICNGFLWLTTVFKDICSYLNALTNIIQYNTFGIIFNGQGEISFLLHFWKTHLMSFCYAGRRQNLAELAKRFERSLAKSERKSGHKFQFGLGLGRTRQCTRSKLCSDGQTFRVKKIIFLEIFLNYPYDAEKFFFLFFLFLVLGCSNRCYDCIKIRMLSG